MSKLDGKNVLITGASSGIGQAIAIRFAQEGANVAINYRSGAEQAEMTRQMAQEAYAAIGKLEAKPSWCRPTFRTKSRSRPCSSKSSRPSARSTCW